MTAARLRALATLTDGQVRAVLAAVATAAAAGLATAAWGLLPAAVAILTVTVGWLVLDRRELLARCDTATDTADRALSTAHALAAHLDDRPGTGRHARTTTKETK